MANEIVTTAQDRMKQSLGSLQRDLGHIRAGRANASLLDRVQVVYYGAPTPLNQLASITIPEARVLMVTPFDKSILKDIEKALYESDLGITPANDGSVIRLVIPMLTEERRRELVKEMGKYIESAKVATVISVVMQWTLLRNQKKQKKSLKMILKILKTTFKK